MATVAGERKEIELVAIGVLAVAAKIRESLCSSSGGHGGFFVRRSSDLELKKRIRNRDEIVVANLVC